MQSVFLRCKVFGKDLGSWFIILGYAVAVVGIIALVQDWMHKSAISDSMGDFPTSVQGFVPFLDSLPPSPESYEKLESSLIQRGERRSMASLTSIAPWEIVSSPQNDLHESVPEGLGTEMDQERWLPDRLVIPAIQLDVPIEATQYEEVEILGVTYRQWLAPESRTVGWQATSAGLGMHGNTVLIGHHNIYGEVFRDLALLEVGDPMKVYSNQKVFEYRIKLKMILPEKYETVDTRLENARWIHATLDERVTLVTCWPYETNTHRLILVAEPIGEGSTGYGETIDWVPD
jgi:LPXTG-site transpeptidase (sortase) family protein